MIVCAVILSFWSFAYFRTELQEILDNKIPVQLKLSLTSTERIYKPQIYAISQLQVLAQLTATIGLPHSRSVSRRDTE